MVRTILTAKSKPGRIGVAIAALAFGVSACVGGTTYGTGVTQEKQTVEDVYNMFTLSKRRNNIDYSARPDLVVPEDTASLPEPLEDGVTTSNPEWPETPDERIAKIRAQAPEEDPRTGLVPIEDRLRKKEGIDIETRDINAENRESGIDRYGNPILGFDAKRKEQHEEVLKRKKELQISSTPTRRYLTEPPVEYLEPAESAPTGEDAFTEEQLAERKRKELEEKKRARAEMRVNNTPLPGTY